MNHLPNELEPGQSPSVGVTNFVEPIDHLEWQADGKCGALRLGDWRESIHGFAPFLHLSSICAVVSSSFTRYGLIFVKYQRRMSFAKSV